MSLLSIMSRLWKKKMTNYNLEMEKEIDRLAGGEKLLLHSCCGPCSTWVIQLLKDYFKLGVLFYNPNIHPKEEYLLRKAEQIRFLEDFPEIDFIDSDYELEVYDQLTCGLEDEPEGGARCTPCFKFRLEKTADLAEKLGYSYFTTTLTISPHKNAKLINFLGQEAVEGKGVKFLPSDFKKKDGFRKSIQLADKASLYRQDYCGCRYSLRDRRERED